MTHSRPLSNKRLHSTGTMQRSLLKKVTLMRGRSMVTKLGMRWRRTIVKKLGLNWIYSAGAGADRKVKRRVLVVKRKYSNVW
jgi:hypothetical protein